MVWKGGLGLQQFSDKVKNLNFVQVLLLVCFPVRNSLQCSFLLFGLSSLTIQTMRKLKVIVGNTYNTWLNPNDISRAAFWRAWKLTLSEISRKPIVDFVDDTQTLTGAIEPLQCFLGKSSCLSWVGHFSSWQHFANFWTFVGGIFEPWAGRCHISHL